MPDRSQRYTYEQNPSQGSYQPRSAEHEYFESGQDRTRQYQGNRREEDGARQDARYADREGQNNYGYSRSQDRNRGYGREEYGVAYGEAEGRTYGRESGYGNEDYDAATTRSWRGEQSPWGHEYNQQGGTPDYYSGTQGEYGRRSSSNFERSGEPSYDRFGGRSGSYGRGEDHNAYNRGNERRSSWFDNQDSGFRNQQNYRSSDSYGQGGDRDDRYQRESWGSMSFAGRGPKGYKRSDERLTEDINERLMQHPEIDASEIEVQVENSEVTLTGSVNNRRAKHLAEDLVDSISGVSDVNNQLRVSKNDHSSTSSQQNAQTSNQSTGSRENPGDRRSTEAATNKGGSPQSARGKASSS